MKLENIKENWEGFAKTDPMWSILTNNNNWDKELFFNSGHDQINEWFNIFNELKNLDFEQALDFGCGMGRLSQALCSRFKKVTGVDISKTMIQLANENNQFVNKCSYIVNEQADLSCFESNTFDFILSSITLQHIPKKYIYIYINEFIRILKPGGKIIFSLPSKPPFIYRMTVTLLTHKLINKFRKLIYKYKYVMEMYWINKKKLSTFINTNGKLISTYPDKSAGDNWEGYIYIVTK